MVLDNRSVSARDVGIRPFQFSNLTKAEVELLRAVQTTDSAICGPSDDPDAPGNDPHSNVAWSEERWHPGDSHPLALY